MYFDEIADFINDGLSNSGKVLVHCAIKASRSPTAIIAFLIKFQKIHFDEPLVLTLVKKTRSLVDGFIEQLKEYEKNVFVSIGNNEKTEEKREQTKDETKDDEESKETIQKSKNETNDNGETKE